ncbi:hypothetical protein B0O41_4034 [Propionibacteriaceae bacterium ES.041]|uniref:CocE/NonD family hydrolase n=1 Tax=Enemella evansiae TaxID=2016499 RepID=UPI000B967CCE|nr:CocE/NonD family hydrolase [Enemella evansiae]OYO14090.1 hypothetical protein BI335_12900 [Enemella evansiae]PFG69181.1 hypothetical protein B0O41_4034 [Propionibacteriaceae bacterium ES.041]TDO89474.1 hypothetical protein C8D81_2346 [Enemella evansiae]
MLRRPLLAATAALTLGPLTLGIGPALAYAAPPAATDTAAAPAPVGAAPGITNAQNDRVPDGAAWSEDYFGSTDGVELHADILRPANLKPTDRSPVILSVGPYFAHIGQTGDDGFSQTGPSERFNDLIEGGQLMERGYTVVLVDLRGFGGSTGCLDWGGPGEQADVDAAIRWSATQPWSTGKVGLYGKSYDGVTGLIGNNLGTPGLSAVVAQEPVWDLYNYLFSNGVPRPNVTGTPRAYNSIASLPGMADDTDRYKKNADFEKSNPQCFANNLSNNNNPDHNSPYWQARNLAAQAAGSSTPLIVTQGFLENNTKPEAMETYLNNHTGEERGWLGPWEHVRGNETDSAGRLKMGREGWFDEVMRFYDKNLKGIQPSVIDPNFAVQDNYGSWRQQAAWTGPRTDFSVNLQSGTFIDAGRDTRALATEAAQGQRNGQKWDMENAPPGNSAQARSRKPAKPGNPGNSGEVTDSYVRYSQPVKNDVRLTGTPKVTMQVDVPPGVTSSQVMVRLWDVSPGAQADGSRQAVMFNENVARISGDGELSFELKSQDWKLLAGHSLAVSIGSVDGNGSWIVTPTNQPIRVKQAKLDLATQNPAGDIPTHGGRAPWLDYYLERYTGSIPAGNGTFALKEAKR